MAAGANLDPISIEWLLPAPAAHGDAAGCGDPGCGAHGEVWSCNQRLRFAGRATQRARPIRSPDPQCLATADGHLRKPGANPIILSIHPLIPSRGSRPLPGSSLEPGFQWERFYPFGGEARKRGTTPMGVVSQKGARTPTPWDWAGLRIAKQLPCAYPFALFFPEIRWIRP